ncbi:MAG TPA: formylglycine-generating enzyme family protein [Zoogloea sp.]|nr:formylglycine-generating enzyme family protein [Zoogloea sp.]
MAAELQPTPVQPSPLQATSRADLLRWLARSGGPVDSLGRVAGLLGFEELAGDKGVMDDAAPSLGSNGTEVERYTPSLQLRINVFASGARFFAVHHHEPSRAATHTLDDYHGPECLRGVAPITEEDLRPLTPGAHVPRLPLVPWPRLWPFLKLALGGDSRAGLDVPRLARQLARGEVLHHLPHLKRRRWAPEAVVLIDFAERLLPFWEDFNALCAQLLPLRGALGLRLLKMLDQPGGPCQPWREPDAPARDWPALATGTPLLILGDLALLEGPDSATRQRWLDFGRQLRGRGVRPLVLAPIGTEHLDEDVLTVFDVVCWSPDTALRPRRVHALNIPQADGAACPRPVDDLLALLSPAIRIEPELLRAALRLLDTGGLQAGLEADFWLHPDVAASTLGCTLHAASQADHRARFGSHPPALQVALLQLLRQHHGPCHPAVLHEETLTWASLAAPAAQAEFVSEIQAAARFMLGTAAAFYQASHHLEEGKVAYARRSLIRAHPGLRENQRYLDVLYAQAWRDALEAGTDVPVTADGLDTREILRALTPSAADPRLRSLVQRGADLWLDGAHFESDPNEILSSRSLLLQWQFAAPVIELETTSVGGDVQRVLVPVKQGAQRLASLDQTLGRLRLLTEQGKILIESLVRPSWAKTIGRDEFGLWCEVEWLGRRLRLPWGPQGDGANWGWQGREGVGVDEFGLYAEFSAKGVSQRCRWIAPGTFPMGSPPDESSRSDDETLHEVTLSRGYWLADTACTQALWQAVMGENPSFFQDDPAQPVEQVSWEAVQTFLDRLNALVPGLDAGLPSEAQWEYACRAGTTAPFSFGRNITPEQVNYDGNYPYAGAEKGLYRERTVAVGSLPPNPWGLYEMHGNVWEWCADWYGPYPDGSQIDPAGPPDGSWRVLRGGSWFSDAQDCRSACRYGIPPVVADHIIGFRLAPGQRPAGEASRHADGQAQAERAGQAGGGDAGVQKGGLINRVLGFFKKPGKSR